MNPLISKIILGTVQFGQSYGIANKGGKVTKPEAFRILDYANRQGIYNLDTALAYGDSEIVIGEYLRNKPGSFKIISKLPSLKEKNVREVEKSLKESLQRIGTKQLEGYLFHQSMDALSSKSIWDCVVDFKRSGLVKKIGFSIYHPDELIALFDANMVFDVVQFPYSLFDQRFEEHFAEINNRGIEIQARSVFLQGLPFITVGELPSDFKEIRPQLERLQHISMKENISVEALCLNFVLSNAHIDKVLIGVDSLTQLKNNIAGISLYGEKSSVVNQLRELKVEQEEVLLPYLWKIKS